VGDKKATEITVEAANRGTRMHKYLETYIESGEWPNPGSNPYAQHAHKMATVIKVHAMDDVSEIWGSEVSLYVPNIYAGTTDLSGVYKGNPAICDFKQSNRPKKSEWVDDYRLQIVAYAIAHNEVYGTDIKEGHIFMCSQDLTYQQFDIWPHEFDDWAQKWWKRVEEYYIKHG
jgi:genome maintenance exonuclease 1